MNEEPRIDKFAPYPTQEEADREAFAEGRRCTKMVTRAIELAHRVKPLPRPQMGARSLLSAIESNKRFEERVRECLGSTIEQRGEMRYETTPEEAKAQDETVPVLSERYVRSLTRAVLLRTIDRVVCDLVEKKTGARFDSLGPTPTVEVRPGVYVPLPSSRPVVPVSELRQFRQLPAPSGGDGDAPALP